MFLLSDLVKLNIIHTDLQYTLANLLVVKVFFPKIIGIKIYLGHMQGFYI